MSKISLNKTKKLDLQLDVLKNIYPSESVERIIKKAVQNFYEDCIKGLNISDQSIKNLVKQEKEEIFEEEENEGYL